MKPIRIVQQMAGDEYYDMLEEVLEDGWFYSGDDCCVGAVIYDEDWLLRQNLNKVLDKVWFVSFYAGDLKRALELIPFDLRYIAFRRNFGRIRVYEMKRFKRLLGGL